MKPAVLFLSGFMTIAYVSGVLSERYTLRFDNVDVDKILQNDRLLRKYFNCLMERGKCLPDGTELKKILPDALATDCSKCTERQKEVLAHIIKHLAHHKRDMWLELMEKYDPEMKYRMKFDDEAKKIGVDL